jgi:hypothetical protein
MIVFCRLQAATAAIVGILLKFGKLFYYFVAALSIQSSIIITGSSLVRRSMENDFLLT